MKLHTQIPTLFVAIAALSCAPLAHGLELLAYFNFDGQSENQNGPTPNLTLGGPAAITTGNMGFSGGAGDESLDLGSLADGSFAQTVAGTHFDAAFDNNAMAVAFWQFNTGFGNSSAFWVHSPDADGNMRGFQAHAPWGNGTIFFDQSGCCDPPERLTVAGAAIAGQWQQLVFQRDADGNREIWVDGAMVASAGGGDPLDAFDGILTIGAEGPTLLNSFGGRIDDFAIFDDTLTADQIMELASGENPPKLIDPSTGEDNENDGAGDGMDDGWEVAVGLDPEVDDSGDNPDNDGLTNLGEWNGGENPTDPFDDDSDNDDLTDGEEVNTHGTDPNDPDSDSDGLSDGDEIAANTLPLDPDTDDDDFNDGFEVTNVAFGFDPLVDDSSEDADGDGLNNGDELTNGTDVLVDDTDSDGTNDGDEVSGDTNPYTGGVLGVPPGDPTDPLDEDSDDDTVLDGAETDPGNGSVTDPNNPDTDGDGFDDALEIAEDTSPTDAGDFPNIPTPTATMSWIAFQDLDGDNLWPTIEEPLIPGIAWDFGAPVTPTFGISNLPGVSAWYSAPSATMQSFNDAPLSAAPFTQSTNQPASFELVFRPGDLIDDHLLFETGGNGDGMAFVLLNDVLEFRAQDANSVAQRMILNHTFTAGDEADFQHVVGTIQTGPTGTNMGVLYVNGTAVDTFEATGNVNDWAGGDDSGLGRVTGGTSTGQTGFAPFTGDIAILRFYAGAVLITPEVEALLDELSVGSADSDNDDLPDGWEDFFIGSLDEDGTGNSDDDGLTNAEELANGTNPVEADTDGDGPNDGDELSGAANPYTGGVLGVAPGDPTNPLNPDSDDDGVTDGDETSDTNGSVTDPNNPDTDGDLFEDGIEIANDSNPTDENSLPDVPSFSFIAGLLGSDLTDPENDANDALACILPNCEGLNVILSTSDTADEGWSPGDPVGNEKVYDIFDNKVGPGEAKWCCNGAPQHATVEFEDPVSITHFTVTSSNDTPDRDPRDWQIQGSNDGVTFTPIFIQADDPQLWTARNQTLQVVLPSPSDAYTFIRYEVTRTNNANHAIAEIEYFGTEGRTTLQISDITYNQATQEISITWNSKDGRDYGLYYGTDLEDFGADIDDGIMSQGETTTVTFSNPEPDAPKLFFRVEEN